MKRKAKTTPKEEPKTEEVSAPSSLSDFSAQGPESAPTWGLGENGTAFHKPTWEPFESCRQPDGSYITTWKHPNGELEQWHGDERVYGPIPIVGAE